ncbi:MAG: DUF3987 domain-containing protein [Bacteroidota bacterium]
MQQEQRNSIANTSFQEEIFQNLPDILQKAIILFNDKVEKDVLLAGALGVLSGCLPNIIGTYDTHKVGSNLFVFVRSQAGAGKGTLIYSQYLAKRIHKNKMQKAKEANSDYQDQLEEFRNSKIKHKGASVTRPEPPKQEMLFIPANSSSSAFLSALASNNGRGIMFSSEADTLVSTLKQDWGNYSDSLRCAFHHEPITQLRKVNNEFIEIIKPYLSVVLSGTPGQLAKLIPNSENGLFSRFLYYDLKLKLEWKNIFSSNGIDYENEFDRIAEKICILFEQLENREIPIIFKFTQDQQNVFNKEFERWQNKLATIYGNEIVPSIRRLGLIFFKLSMLLSGLRLIDLQTLPNEIICNSTDFYVAGLLTDTFINNALSIFSGLPKCHAVPFSNKRMNDLYEKLPKEFSREQSIEIANEIGISDSTTDRFLKSDQLFIKTSYGNYQKLL